MGVKFSRATLGNWFIFSSKEYFQPMYDYFHRKLLKKTFLWLTRSVFRFKRSRRSAELDSYMGLFRSGKDGLPLIILYWYTQTRARCNAEAFLSDFEEYLGTDDYQGYNNLPGIKRCYCRSHTRRYFIDAVSKGKEYNYSNPAV